MKQLDHANHRTEIHRRGDQRYYVVAKPFADEGKCPLGQRSVSRRGERDLLVQDQLGQRQLFRSLLRRRVRRLDKLDAQEGFLGFLAYPLAFGNGLLKTVEERVEPGRVA